MNIVVIDDDLAFLDMMKDKLSSLFNARVRLFDEFVEGIINETDNILFLDVMLGNKESFDLGDRLLLKFPNLILVYISNFDHFVYDSYKQSKRQILSVKYKIKKQLGLILTATHDEKDIINMPFVIFYIILLVMLLTRALLSPIIHRLTFVPSFG